MTLQKFDLSVYPNLMKAVEILYISNFTMDQEIAYENRLFALAEINPTSIESFDKGYNEGLLEGNEVGREESFDFSLKLIDDLKRWGHHQCITYTEIFKIDRCN